MDVVESLSTAWTVMEHARTAKRWNPDDLAYIKLAQDGVVEGLINLIGHDKAMKLIANDRIALRKWHDEKKQQKSEDLKNEIEQLDSLPEIDQAIIKGYSY